MQKFDVTSDFYWLMNRYRCIKSSYMVLIAFFALCTEALREQEDSVL